MLLAPLKKLFRPAVKTPEQKLREVRAMLGSWIAAYTAQIDLVNELLDKSERCTAAGLENLLREKFRVYNVLDQSLAALPAFDEDEDDLDYDTMPQQERMQRKAVKQYHDRQFTIHHQMNLIARFAGVSDRRIHDVLHILTAHYTPVEDRPLRGNELAATYFPMIRAWMDGERGMIQELPIPAEFSGWMPEHESMFPVLV